MRKRRLPILRRIGSAGGVYFVDQRELERQRRPDTPLAVFHIEQTAPDHSVPVYAGMQVHVLKAGWSFDLARRRMERPQPVVAVS